MTEPTTPDRETREHLLAELADLLARAGATRDFLMEPVAPTAKAFPERWERTPEGVERLLRRLATHAGIARTVVITDARWGAPPTERKPATTVEVTRATRTVAMFTVGFIGEDDVAGTLAHEMGVLFAMLHRRDGVQPYRDAAAPEVVLDPDRDLERGSIATVAIGLGVLAANAAFQQYSGSGRFNGAYVPLEYDVLRAGHVPMSALAFLLAAQAVARGEPEPPAGLAPPQRDEVAAWMRQLDRATVRAALGIAADAEGAARPPIERLAEAAGEPGSTRGGDGRANAFRYRSHRGGIGLVAGTMLGVGVTVMVATRVPLFVLAGASGHVVGRRIRVYRCTACVAIVPENAATCPKCGAALRGDIAHPSDRLDAEDGLDDRDP